MLNNFQKNGIVTQNGAPTRVNTQSALTQSGKTLLPETFPDFLSADGTKPKDIDKKIPRHR